MEQMPLPILGAEVPAVGRTMMDANITTEIQVGLAVPASSSSAGAIDPPLLSSILPGGNYL